MQIYRLFVVSLGMLPTCFALAEEATVTQHREDIHDMPASGHTLISNVSLVSDYLYRGISQSGAKPAIQGGFDYADSSGFYAGAWSSSISWISDYYTATAGAGGGNNAGLELDTYFGFKSSFGGDFSYDLGYLRYNYPSGNYAPGATKPDTDEIYGMIGYKWVTVKYSHSLGKTFMVPDAKGTYYLDLSASHSIPGTSLTLGAHAGRQKYKGSSAAYVAAGGPSASYSDYKLSISKELRGFVAGLGYSKTSASTAPGAFYKVLDKDLGRGKAVMSLSRTF